MTLTPLLPSLIKEEETDMLDRYVKKRELNQHKLEEQGFTKVGDWQIQNGKIQSKLEQDWEKVVYAFLVTNSSEDYVAYVGKTKNQLKVRMGQYKSHTTPSDKNIFGRILDSLKKADSKVTIWAIQSKDIPPIPNSIAALEEQLLDQCRWTLEGRQASLREFMDEIMNSDEMREVLGEVLEKVHSSQFPKQEETDKPV